MGWLLKKRGGDLSLRKVNKRPSKNSIEIYVPKNDKLFRYYHDLYKDRCTYFEFPDKKTQKGTARSIGINFKPLIKNKFTTPPLKYHKGGLTGLMLKRDVQIKTEKKEKGKIFKFLRL